MFSIHNKKLIFFTGIGAGLEYYDFIIYGLLASYISKAFFPANNTNLAILKTFSVFALGYLVRPFGGLIFSHFGDRFGRKNTFLVSLLLMSFATLIIGILPTYQQSGILAPILLIFLRCLQGISFGSELPNFTTFLMEHADPTNRSLHCGLALCSVAFCAMLASATIYILNAFLSTTQMYNIGWRIPFLLGGGLAILSYFVRKNLKETPLFIKSIPKKWPIHHLIKTYPIFILWGIGISLFSACFIIFCVSLPSFLKQFFGYSSSQIYLSITVGYIWSVLVLPITGLFADKIGRPQLLLWTALGIIVGCFPLFELLHLHQWGLLIFMLVYQLIIAVLANCYLPLLTELFPTSVRFTGVALCYNLVYSVGGLTPLFLFKIVSSFGTHLIPLFFMFLAITTVLSAFVISMKPITGKPLG